MASELWAIANGKKIVGGTNATTANVAWLEFYGIEYTVGKKEMTEFIKRSKIEGYSAVRIKYDVVERDGEESNGPK